jgi:hypothetical protein
MKHKQIAESLGLSGEDYCALRGMYFGGYNPEQEACSHEDTINLGDEDHEALYCSACGQPNK